MSSASKEQYKPTTAGCVTEEQKAEWKRLFQLCDEDQSGVLSWTELSTLCHAIGKPASDTQVKQMIGDADSNGDGLINFQEFERVMTLQIENEWSKKKKDLIKSFTIFDKDGNGFITLEELKHGMNSAGFKLTNDELTCMINQADADGDGQINFREFIQLMKEDQ